jgi:hypothetical protein
MRQIELWWRINDDYGIKPVNLHFLKLMISIHETLTSLDFAQDGLRIVKRRVKGLLVADAEFAPCLQVMSLSSFFCSTSAICPALLISKLDSG